MVGPDYAFFTSLMCELVVAGMKDKYWECESKGKELEQWKARVRNPVDIIDRRTCVLGYRMVGLRSMQHSKFVLFGHPHSGPSSSTRTDASMVWHKDI